MGLLTQPSTDAPLRQGDILKAVQLYETADDGDGAAPVENAAYMLVISRHCNAFRNPAVLVVAITEVKPAVFDELAGKSLDSTRRALAALRDGDGSPDRFYIGPLPGHEPQRAFACLDQVYTIQAPVESSVRSSWISERRIAALTDEHRRHLHASLFLAFGREGFDDFNWWPDGDLRLAIAAGRRAVADAMQKQADIVPNYEGAAPKKVGAIGKQATIATSALKDAEKELEPYLVEWKRRHGDTDPLS